jgi:hypothetical protein
VTSPEDLARAWQPVLMDLAELDEAGALAGVRAIIAERLRQVREGQQLHEFLITCAMALIAGQDRVMPARDRYANAAALLAAVIDSTEHETGDRT